MLVSAYFLNHGLWTVIPDQLKENFDDMLDCGFNAVCLSFSESEMVYSRRAFELQVNLAHEAGLKVFVIPSRIGGRFAGAPLTPSLWLTQNPEAQIPNFSTFFGPVACIEHQAFRDWIKSFMKTLLTDYPLDGIIWDEPKEEQTISHHPDTISKFGPDPTVEEMEDSYLEFLTELTGHCKSLNPELLITLFNQKTSTERFTLGGGSISGIDYAGYDGNLARQSYFHEEPQWHKYRIESVWDRMEDEARRNNKGSFALIENMLMPTVAIPEYEKNLDSFLESHRPDHLSLYYYAHNNEDPHRVHEITRHLMKKHLS
ncbi:hypothetical protein [Puniceicoccus vermicola]|uniref:Uncharacterized protein n=1 Tax=Puniceicoccus vermicola TaxID=388746 RepID=A0A7X1AZ42_9BACT|nr:hypothetical protein [Puniceicoccus vermicola]MBC2602636.1 hypothetical protein [Puniceicoccus vermicola]